ncbi:heparinase II/III family protein [Paenibacillus jilunlii]|uniref:Heparinase II/III-like protein n=1 Tax=Paenibacillus jilunlii TaxID=682956 RepID=A0A1G9LV00_9BACL|nr:heparinase II/III family protein [Paenibacillus jilunlii]KWX72369.1 hypothetical protein AML91_21370 [Paenibacillus jilunlii]SDL65265.1 Heparinase II/III-like protein [Paenibacillus jilunlii]
MNQQELLDIIREAGPLQVSHYYPQGDQDIFWKRAAESGEWKESISEIRAEGLRLEALDIPELTYSLFTAFGRTGSRLEYERVYFERRRRLNTYALLVLLEPENPGYLRGLEDILWSICGEYTWCVPAHLPPDFAVTEIGRFIDLFSSETGFTLSEISLLLGGRLSPLLRARISAEVERRIFRPFLEDGPYHWETVTHNWSAVCAGSIGAAAMLALDDPAQLSRILHKTERSMHFYLEGFGEDGACAEGLGYWNYGFGYFTYYSDLLRARSGGKLDWFQCDKVRSIAAFQQKCFIGGSLVANFSDSTLRVRVHMGLSHYLAAKYSCVEAPPAQLRAPYTEDHCSRWAPALRNLIWTRQARVAQEWGAASFYLPDAAWIVVRHGSPEKVFGFAAKGGHNDEPHNHNDLGHFILAGGGEVYAADLGSGEYTADYFGKGRYRYDCNGSQGHSVPIISGRYQSAGPEYTAAVLHAATGADKDELKLELSKAYETEGLKSLIRSLVWHKEELPRLELCDEYLYEGATESWTERFVTWRQPELLRTGIVLLPGSDGGGVAVHYDNKLVEPEITPREYRDHYGRETVWHTLDFHVLRPGSEGRFVFTFQFLS